MNKDEICFKLIEFYFKNKRELNSWGVDLDYLFEKYNKMLKKLGSD